jgi:hypothetical protein
MVGRLTDAGLKVFPQKADGSAPAIDSRFGAPGELDQDPSKNFPPPDRFRGPNPHVGATGLPLEHNALRKRPGQQKKKILMSSSAQK